MNIADTKAEEEIFEFFLEFSKNYPSENRAAVAMIKQHFKEYGRCNENKSDQKMHTLSAAATHDAIRHYLNRKKHREAFAQHFHKWRQLKEQKLLLELEKATAEQLKIPEGQSVIHIKETNPTLVPPSTSNYNARKKKEFVSKSLKRAIRIGKVVVAGGSSTTTAQKVGSKTMGLSGVETAKIKVAVEGGSSTTTAQKVGSKTMGLSGVETAEIKVAVEGGSSTTTAQKGGSKTMGLSGVETAKIKVAVEGGSSTTTAQKVGSKTMGLSGVETVKKLREQLAKNEAEMAKKDAEMAKKDAEMARKDYYINLLEKKVKDLSGDKK